MAIAEVIMPKMGESIMEATILKWYKKVGDHIKQDETLLDIATDKVDSEVPSSVEGTVTELLYSVNDVVAVGSIIARIQTAAENNITAQPVSQPQQSYQQAPPPQPVQQATAPAYQQPEPAAPVYQQPAAQQYYQPAQPQAAPPAPVYQQPVTQTYQPVQHPTYHTPADQMPFVPQGAVSKPGNNRFFSPLVLNIANSEGLSLSELERIPGTGADGRVSKKDVLQYIADKKSGKVPAFTAPQPQIVYVPQPAPPQPAYVPPVYNEPAYTPAPQPAYVAPVFNEPVYTPAPEPVYTAPVYNEPVYTPAPQPVYVSPAEEYVAPAPPPVEEPKAEPVAFKAPQTEPVAIQETPKAEPVAEQKVEETVYAPEPMEVPEPEPEPEVITYEPQEPVAAVQAEEVEQAPVQVAEEELPAAQPAEDTVPEEAPVAVTVAPEPEVEEPAPAPQPEPVVAPVPEPPVVEKPAPVAEPVIAPAVEQKAEEPKTAVPVAGEKTAPVIAPLVEQTAETPKVSVPVAEAAPAPTPQPVYIVPAPMVEETVAVPAPVIAPAVQEVPQPAAPVVEEKVQETPKEIPAPQPVAPQPQQVVATSIPQTFIQPIQQPVFVASPSYAETIPLATLAESSTGKYVNPSSVIPSGNTEIIEMDRMRKIIAKHMVDSKHTSPHVTSFVEADVTNMVLWRNRVKDDFEKREGTKITFTPMFIECLVNVLQRYPIINSSVDGDRIVVKKDFNIGMATALPSGNLIVPVIKGAEKLNIVGLSTAVNNLANAARNNKLKPDDINGGTFTFTNVGTFGSLMGTPIINQPQVAILAVGAIKKRPVVIESASGDTIGIRHMMYLSLSYDHRVIDGSVGASFLTAVAQEFEKWNVNRTWYHYV